MNNALNGLEPKAVWEIFEGICSVPRPAKKEEKIIKHILEFAAKHNIEALQDAAGNVVLRKPATPGMENRMGVALQGHIDMVCEKNSDVEFDFDNDPIQCYVDGDWVKARGTTLGADNGIGVAMSMAILQSTDIPHPPLEALFTLDEETGLTGAIKLETGLLRSDILVNLDSEEDDAFTIGCAGGINTSGSFKYIADAVPAGYNPYKISIKGLRGGHSGIEIHDGRANAAKLLNRIIFNLNKNFGIRLSSFVSGNKHNAIPREAFAEIVIEAGKEAEMLKMIEKCNGVLKSEYESKEPNLLLSAEKCDMPARIMSEEMQKRIMLSFYAMPHGVIRMSPDIKGLVQTSTNFAIIETRADDVYVLTSQRSSVETEKKDVADMVASVLAIGGADVEMGDGYPAWQPNVHSPILGVAKDIYTKLNGVAPNIEAIHAGLECGLIGEKYPGMDMLSFGPNLKDVHSPDERCQISSVQKTWKLLLEILKNIPVKA